MTRTIAIAVAVATAAAGVWWLDRQTPVPPVPPARAFSFKPGDPYYMTREQFLRGIPDPREPLPLELRKPWLFPHLDKPKAPPTPRPKPGPRSKAKFFDI